MSMGLTCYFVWFVFYVYFACFTSTKNLYTGFVIGGYMVQSSKLLSLYSVMVLVGGFQTHYTGFARKNMIGVGKNSWSFPKYWMVLQLLILLLSKPRSRLSGLCHSMILPKLELVYSLFLKLVVVHVVKTALSYFK